ncbi:hypothetical protein EDD85DRAFT_975210 [Armillaria nabsnona]|nr:hypothetical protein EDD85DRAFT_975210 [Armillaria nabsnona]
MILVSFLSPLLPPKTLKIKTTLRRTNVILMSLGVWGMDSKHTLSYRVSSTDMMYIDLLRTEGPNFSLRQQARAFAGTSLLFSTATRCELYRSGEETHERDITGINGCRVVGRRMTTDTLAVVSSNIDVRVLKPVSTSGQPIVILPEKGLKEMETIEEMELIEETATRMPLLSFIGQLPKHKIVCSNDVLQTRLHLQPENGKGGIDVAAPTFCLFHVCAPATVLSLEAGGTQLSCHFSGGGHSQLNPGGEACKIQINTIFACIDGSVRIRLASTVDQLHHGIRAPQPHAIYVQQGQPTDHHRPSLPQQLRDPWHSLYFKQTSPKTLMSSL